MSGLRKIDKIKEEFEDTKGVFRIYKSKKKNSVHMVKDKERKDNKL
jgi:hypothetical protein